MVKCEDCLRLFFEGPCHEYPGEWWGHRCDDDDSVLNKIEEVEITKDMIEMERYCPQFKQFACAICGKLLKHEYQKHDEDLCDPCSAKFYSDMAREQGLM